MSGRNGTTAVLEPFLAPHLSCLFSSSPKEDTVSRPEPYRPWPSGGLGGDLAVVRAQVAGVVRLLSAPEDVREFEVAFRERVELGDGDALAGCGYLVLVVAPLDGDADDLRVEAIADHGVAVVQLPLAVRQQR